MDSCAVVIAAWNAAGTIEAALSSVCEQTRLPNEIIVVDDGSTDDTRTRAESYLRRNGIDHRVLHQENCGPAPARNSGWRASRAEWIHFLDADDAMATNAIELLGGVSTDETVAAVYAPWQRQKLESGSWVASGPVNHARIDNDNTVASLLQSDGFIQLGSARWSRSWLHKVNGFDAAYHPIEDVNLQLRIAFAGGRFVAVPAQEPLAFYRQRPDSFSRRDRTAFLSSSLGNVRLVEAEWRKRGELTSERSDLLADLYWNAAYAFADDASLYDEISAEIAQLPSAEIRLHSALLRAVMRIGGLGAVGRLLRVYRKTRRMIGRSA